ncbi:MAG: Membrane protein [uncultured Friedmanniella sp.]|uniref:Membrane protein n=1 Tax=uncultured Friedmanniella sp. TaxID=335381 RepID=A0A6J4KHN3_9ACTN|nr:MAG: Membrane protein [uncultured Friedmanniella sp.]
MLKLPITLSEIAPRISAGAFILNSGLGKRAADDETAAGLHGFASGTYPFLQKVPPQQFVQGLSVAEMAVGGVLLAPFVPTFTAGAVLTAFSGGLLGLYLKTPGMRKPGSLAPTEQGLALAKDSWLVGIGIGLMTRGLIERRPRVTVKKAAKQAKRAAKDARRGAKAAARA